MTIPSQLVTTRRRNGLALTLIVLMAGTSLQLSSHGVQAAGATPVQTRVTAGLLSLYNFNEGAGSTVRDVSGVGTPVDLSIAAPSATDWQPGGLDVVSPTLISSPAPATKITQAVRMTEQLTVEAWVTPASTLQGGPARVVAMSGGATGINVALDQGRQAGLPSSAFISRMRSTVTTNVGSTMGSGKVATTTPMHLVYTREPYGTQRLLSLIHI